MVTAPPTRRDGTAELIQGVKVEDPYRWLEDAGRPEVLEWMRAQDAETRRRLEAVASRAALRARLDALYRTGSIGVPIRRGERLFYARRRVDQEKEVVYWKPGDRGPERVLFDPNVMSPDGSISLGQWSPSWDGKFVAYSLHRNNADRATLRVRDVDGGRDLPLDEIEDARYAAPSWTPDSKGFYYTWLPVDPRIDPAALPGRAEVRFHALGTAPSRDVVVHPALGDPSRSPSAAVSHDGRWLVLAIYNGWTSNDVYVMDLARSAAADRGGESTHLEVRGCRAEEATASPGWSGGEAGAPTRREENERTAAGPSVDGERRVEVDCEPGEKAEDPAWGAGDASGDARSRADRPARGASSTVGNDERPAGAGAHEHGGPQLSPSPAIAAGFVPLAVGGKAHYVVIPWKDAFYVMTDEGAPLYRIFKVDPQRPERSSWREIVPESDTTLQQFSIIGGHLVLTRLVRAMSAMEVRDLEGRLVRTVRMPGPGTTEGMVGNPDEDEAYFSFESFTEPDRVLRTSIRAGRVKEWASIRVPVRTSSLTTEQVFFTSKDGTRISMFLVYRKGMKRTGANPTFLTGYGGFNINKTPVFSPAYLAWVERGGVLAMPNLRGGGEYGEEWHRAGMLLRKQNVFDDFIAAAEFLVAERITSPAWLAIEGGSNGGLLVGAAMVQRPELFRAVICAVPLLDMVRYHRFGSGMTWVSEYGSAEDPEQFRALYSYSPYHHVKEKVAYPAMLMLSADSDDRVDPMHARKFTAAIQWATTSGRPVLLRIETQSGHTGADLVRQKVEQWADVFAFLDTQIGAP